MSKRRLLIAGNWKMNLTGSDASRLVNELLEMLGNTIKKVDILMCPPYTSIASAKSALSHSENIFIGAQNFFPEKNGAFTGEISPVMLRELGVSHVIVGHSERREYFHETDDNVNKKVRFALANSLLPILCVGETLSQRQSGKALEVIDSQIVEGLKDVTAEEAERVTIAYEPIWAIGTGETATPDIAQEMHASIRKRLESIYTPLVADHVRILYGGSMKPENAQALLDQPDIDGGLIGGASLKASSFSAIINIASDLVK